MVGLMFYVGLYLNLWVVLMAICALVVLITMMLSQKRR